MKGYRQPCLYEESYFFFNIFDSNDDIHDILFLIVQDFKGELYVLKSYYNPFYGFKEYFWGGKQLEF